MGLGGEEGGMWAWEVRREGCEEGGEEGRRWHHAIWDGTNNGHYKNVLMNF